MRAGRRESGRVLRQLREPSTRPETSDGLPAWNHATYRFTALLHPDHRLGSLYRGAGVGAFSRKPQGTCPRFSRLVSIRGLADRGLGIKSVAQLSTRLGTSVLQDRSSPHE